MKRIQMLFNGNLTLLHTRFLLSSTCQGLIKQMGASTTICTDTVEPEMKEFMKYMDSLKNYEKSGVPKGAGMDTKEGFDLGRMRRLVECLGNPHSNFKIVHIAGTKGKGSTAAFISNILRAEGYSVGCYTSPHIQTIRERISLGRQGEPVSAMALNCLFHRVKRKIDQAIKLEEGSISHFEVLTAMAFALFAEAKVDIAVIEAGLGGARDATNIISSSELAAAVITTVGEEHLAALGGSLETIAIAKSGIIKQGNPVRFPLFMSSGGDLVVLGGPFHPHIECILREKASSMGSPVVSASDSGNKSAIRSFGIINGRPCQSCDIKIQIERDLKLFCDLPDVKLCMLGSHQLQNAVTATCVTICLRNLGWRVSDGSIRRGLESTYLLGRSQFLTSKEAERIGLHGTRVLLDGAHTKESAKALMNTIQMAYPEARLGLVVAMACDKDHVGFARELLSGGFVEAVFLTEASIAGSAARTTSTSLLRDCWVQACKELGINALHEGMAAYREVMSNQLTCSASNSENGPLLAMEGSLMACFRTLDQILKKRVGDQKGIILVTGSLHIVASALASLHV